MLLNRYQGFEVPRARPTIRFVGQYDVTFAGGTSETITVPDADLSPASTERQILVFTAGETQPITDVSIAGVAAGSLMPFEGGGGFVNAWAAPYAGEGPFNILVTGAASSQDTGILVFEVDKAAPLHECQIVGGSTATTSLALATLRVPRDGIAVGFATSLTETNSFTWSSLTEIFDADVGGQSLSAAVRTAYVQEVPGADLTETITQSAAATMAGMVMAIAPKRGLLTGRVLDEFATTAAGATITLSNFNLENMGTAKLVVVIALEADGLTPTVSYNGVAMNLVGSVTNTGASPDLVLRMFELDVNLTAAPDASFVIGGVVALASVHWSIYALWNCHHVGDVQSAQGNATGAALALDVAEGGFIIADHIRATDTQTVTWTGVNEKRDADAGPYRISPAYRALCGKEDNRVVQAVGSASGQYATIAAAFNP
jgi:hypothetical protein